MFLHAVVSIFLGLPGILLVTGGFGFAVFIFLGVALGRVDFSLKSLVTGAGSFCLCLIGYTMTVAAEMMTGTRRHGVSARDLLAILGLEFLVLTLATFSATSVISTIATWDLQEFSWEWLIADLILVAGLFATVKIRRSRVSGAPAKAPLATGFSERQ